MHAVCQNLSTEEEVESTADSGFDCSMCRPYIPPANGKKLFHGIFSTIAELFSMFVSLCGLQILKLIAEMLH